MINWYDTIFIKKIEMGFKEDLPKKLKVEYNNFTFKYNNLDYLNNVNELDDWYKKSESQLVLLELIKNLVDKLSYLSNSAMPAHDARHAIFKVSFFGLSYIKEEGYLYSKRLAILGCLGHDYGRWAEERIYGHPNPGSIHSRLSYVLMREFLSDYEIPKIIKDEILYSVIKHTTGADDTDNPIIKVVVSSDRDQLIGCERILRSIHHQICNKENECLIDTEENIENCELEGIARISLLRLKGPLYSLKNIVNDLIIDSNVFLLMCLSEDKLITLYDRFKSNNNIIDKDIFNNNLKEAKKIAENWAETDIDIEKSLLDLLTVPNLTKTIDNKDLIQKKISNLTEEKKKKISNAIQWVIYRINIVDENQYKQLHDFSLYYNEDWLNYFIDYLISNWNNK